MSQRGQFIFLSPLLDPFQSPPTSPVGDSLLEPPPLCNHNAYEETHEEVMEVKGQVEQVKESVEELKDKVDQMKSTVDALAGITSGLTDRNITHYVQICNLQKILYGPGYMKRCWGTKKKHKSKKHKKQKTKPLE